MGADPRIKTLKLLLWRLRIDEEINLSGDAFPTAKVATLIEKHFKRREDEDDVWRNR